MTCVEYRHPALGDDPDVPEAAYRSRRHGRACTARPGSRRIGKCNPRIQSPRNTPESGFLRPALKPRKEKFEPGMVHLPVSGTGWLHRKRIRLKKMPRV